MLHLILLVLSAIVPLSSSTISDVDYVVYDTCIRQLNRQINTLYNTSLLQPPSFPTYVNTQLTIIAFAGIDDDEQTVELSLGLRFSWYDQRLIPALAECANLTSSFVVTKTYSLPWYPQYTTKNSEANVLYTDAWNYCPVNIYPNGTVVWTVYMQTSIKCALDVSLFPFDYQECQIDVGSPFYPAEALVYTVQDTTNVVNQLTADSVVSPVWTIVGQSYEALVGYPGISFLLLARRGAEFYVCSLVIPILTINCMIVGVYILPGNQHEKWATSQVPMLALFLFDITFYDFIPKSSDNMPFLNIFFIIQMFIALICQGFAGFLFKLGKKEADLKEFLTEQLIYSHWKLYLFNSKTLNQVALFCYFGIVGGSYLAAVIYMSVSVSRASALSQSSYMPLQTVPGSISSDIDYD